MFGDITGRASGGPTASRRRWYLKTESRSSRAARSNATKSAIESILFHDGTATWARLLQYMPQGAGMKGQSQGRSECCSLL
ncbi:hypothetical protein CPLU01_07169 [Colletotrichum plurivorum]|uniref:Uncharacterized protein n=1 Tax=Colletotrichum plurivorum TaxID=2175906 RepID=A0A8H6KFK3_9PEZI|nr:hypothetical protein CPLU01_07169 [Colletotrichum plurivorum]